MADNGLLAGIGNALTGAVSGYKTAQDIQREALLAKQKQSQQDFENRVALLKNNLQLDPTSGTIQPNELGNKLHQVEEGKADFALNALKPDSAESSSIRGLLQSSGMTAVPENLSGYGAEQFKGLLGTAAMLPYRQARIDIMGKNADTAAKGVQVRSAQLGESQSQHAAQAGAAFSNDPLLKQMTNTQNSLKRALSIMDGKTPVTAQNFNMLQQDLINAVAQGGAATEGKVNREMVNTLAAQLNEIATKFGDIKDLRQAQPKVFSQLRGLLMQVGEDYNKAYDARSKEIGENFEGHSNQKVKDVVAKKLKRTSPGLIEQPAAGATPAAPKVDPKIDTYAKQNSLSYDQAAQLLKSRGYNGQ